MIGELNQLVDDLATAAATVERRAQDVVDDTKAAVKDTAVELVAVRDGELRDSIEETEDGVEATAPHAPFVENGTYKDPPQPFMGPAADRHEGSFVTKLEEVAADI